MWSNATIASIMIPILICYLFILSEVFDKGYDKGYREGRRDENAYLKDKGRLKDNGEE